jgi:thioredoxin reductase
MKSKERSTGYDAIIVGGGPAGLNAALVLGRARRRILLYDDGSPRNAAVDQMHGFLTRDGADPHDVRRLAVAELERYPSVEIVSARVASAGVSGDGFIVLRATGEADRARRLLIATGVVDVLPEVDGLRERWGCSVFVCPFCDGWEFRDRRIAVVAPGRVAIELAQELAGWSRDLIVCPSSDCLTAADRSWIAASGAQLHVGSLARLRGPGAKLESIAFDDGSSVACDVLFVSAPLRQHSPLFALLGCALTSEHAIAVDAAYQTSVAGCYAAGDAVTSVHQAIVAAASGARAAIAITSDLLAEDALRLAGGSAKGMLRDGVGAILSR